MHNNQQVFISHSSEDRQIAISLCNYLEAHNISCWMAPRNIHVGKDYAQSIIEAIEHSAVMILILSTAANNSKHVRNEIERAFNHELVIMAFRVQNIIPNKTLEYFLSASHWLDGYSDKPEKYFESLLNNCRAALDIPDTGNAAPPVKESLPAENKTAAINSKVQTKKKSFIILPIACLLVIITASLIYFKSKNSPAEKNNLPLFDSSSAMNNSGNNHDNTGSNTAKNDTVKKTSYINPVVKSKAQPTQKTGDETTAQTIQEDTKPAAKLSALANGIYWQPDNNDELDVSSSGYFSGTVQNKSVAGKLKAGSGNRYKISGNDISGNINFSDDYQSLRGDINFKGLGVSVHLNMVKK